MASRRFGLLGLVVAIVLVWSLWKPFRGPRRDINFNYGLLRHSDHPRYAIATFLSENTDHARDEDYYFIATRILTYQLLHDPKTKCTHDDIPFLVVVTKDVSQEKRDRLTRDGATVVEVEDVPLHWWIRTGVTRWKDQFTKLRILQMTEFDRVLFIDADTILTRPIDEIFEQECVEPSTTLFRERPDQVLADEAQPPAQYVFCARSDNALAGERNHPFPPNKTDVFSAGFWMAAPSEELYEYLMSVTGHYRRFDPTTMEQSLLNYAFRRDGAMPWKELDYHWSATWPGIQDLEGNVASLHEKLWKTGPGQLRAIWWDLKRAMENYYEKQG